MSNTTFLNNQAEFGAAFSHQEIQDGIYTYNNLTFIHNTTSMLLLTSIKNQIKLNSGGLTLQNIKIPQLMTPFFSLNSGTAKIQGINIENLECQADEPTSFYRQALRDDPSNYRGITVTPVPSKMFAILLEARLSAWAEFGRRG